ncbi:guanine nucleotide binding protein, alpha subunit [Serendipita vermifera]|nr:guanine nucleotide binding protein, alpha subunit [Serendipita vermifera]
MGQCFSSGQALDEQARYAEQVMKDAKKSMNSHTKLLLLGTGDAGKSTILKQIRLINSIPFTSEEVETFRHRIFANLVDGMRLVRNILDESDLSCSDETWRILEELDSAPEIADNQPYPQEYLGIFKTLWHDPDVQKGLLLGKQLALPDNYFNNLDRLFEPKFVPAEQDIIFSRARTIGVSETVFTFKKQIVSVIDVGGQRSERRKWIHFFQGVTAIIFLVSLAGYDQVLVEDRTANQMQDAMVVWESICSSPWFEHTHFILFLNKVDLFEQKVLHSPIKRFFPDYEGKETSLEDGKAYFKRRFLSLHAKANRTLQELAKSPTRPKIPVSTTTHDIRKVYPYFTTATDTDAIRKVMKSVNDIVLLDNLAESHML